ncbi:hypothetical protein H4R19_005369, partial [Coemansia spiralis]
FKSGVLVKDGRQTSCDLLVVDSKASVVAASCLDYAGDGKLAASTKYEVYLDDGIDGKAVKYSVDSVTVQPYYDPKSFVNNMAVLQYNAGGSVTWGNQFAPGADLGFDSVVYSRRTVADLGQMKWDDAREYSYPDSTDNPIYREGGDRGACKAVAIIPSEAMYNVASTAATIGLSSAKLTDCPAPYGILYVTHNSTVLLLGIHSHTFVRGGTNMCSNSAQCSYYALSYLFTGYISSVIGRRVGTGVAVLGDLGLSDPQSRLSNTTYRTIGLATLSGDMFEDASSDKSSLESSSEESSGSSSDVSTASSAESTSRSGLSQGGVIAVAVCASIGGLLIVAAAAFFAVRRWRTRNLRDRAGIEQVHDMLGGEPGYGAPPTLAVGHDLPPVYDDPPSSSPTSGQHTADPFSDKAAGDTNDKK